MGLINPFTKHPNETDSPEGYWVHFNRSFTNGWVLIWAGTAAVVHAVFPWWFKFYTAETIIRIYWTTLHTSGRHRDLIKEYEKS